MLLKIDLCIDGLELKKVKETEEDELISSYDEYEEFDNALKEIEEELEQQEVVRNEVNDINDLFSDTSTQEKLEIPVNIDSVNNSKDNFMNDEEIYVDSSDNNKETKDVTSIFSAFKDTDETFTTYSIYIIREGDSLETVINKYKTTKDILSEYNDLSDVRIGTKIIVPSRVTNE